MKKTPPPRVTAPVELDFVMARVFDLYRQLATRERTMNAKAPNAARYEPRKARGTVE